MRRLLLPALLGFSLTACPAKPTAVDAGFVHVASPKWEEQVIYFVLTDRFANGDVSNDDQHAGEFDPKNKDKYSGGDLQGIIDQLDYIQGLGATAVWITPPVANMWWDPEQKSGGYHGYWARNLKKVDEHFGTVETYKRLSEALHQRGMYLIQDVVPNHMGNFFSWFACDDAGMNCTSKYPTACQGDYTAAGCDVSQGAHLNTGATPASKPDQAPFDQNDPRDPTQRAAGIYHWTPQILDFGSGYQQWYWALSDLDDLNTENPVVRKALRDSYGYWVKEVGVDAFRVDTAKFVPHDFWNDFFYSDDAEAPGIMNVAKATGRTQFHAFGEFAETSGELQSNAEDRMLPYFGSSTRPEFPALLAYPLFGEINAVFAQGNPTANMTYRLNQFMKPALNPYLTPTFIDNHDQSRFLSVSNGLGLIEGMVFIFTIPGIPTVYYGTEQGFMSTRQSMFDGGYGAVDGDAFRPQIGMYKIIKQLAELRRQHKSLTLGTLEVLADTTNGPGVFVYRRQYEGETVIVFMNTSDQSALLTNMTTGLAPGTVLENWYALPAVAAPKVDAAGKATMAMAPRQVMVTHVTTDVVAPGAAAATITVSTELEGKTFTTDTVINGTVSPATTKLRMVLNGDIDGAAKLTVQTDGTWSATLPVSTFPVGKHPQSLTFYAPEANVASAQYHFTTDVAFAGMTLSVDDPAGDDHGPAGFNYAYPSDSSFTHQMDVTNVTALVGATTLKLQLTMSALTSVWAPDLGFDHVVFNVFFQVPGQAGLTALPLLSANAPSGFTWNYGQSIGGYKADNKLFNTVGANETTLGQLLTVPGVTVSGKTVTLEYDRTRFLNPTIPSWTGVKVYVTTWDYDGVQKIFRPISQAGAPYEFGRGNPTDPHIMDDVTPFTLQGP